MAAVPSGVEESPDSMERRCRVTPGRGDPTESATENRPPPPGAARVKRWGKSPPRTGQPGRHGKPHREQCRIGLARAPRRPGPLQPQQGRVGSWSPVGDGGPRGMVIRGGETRRDRIRLTGHPRIFSRGPLRHAGCGRISGRRGRRRRSVGRDGGRCHGSRSGRRRGGRPAGGSSPGRR